MYDLRLIRLLLTPSFFSLTLTLILSLMLIGYNAWLYLSEEQLFYDYLFGSYGLKTYIWQHSQNISSWQGAFLNNPAVYYVLVGAVAIAAGLIVYFSLQLLGLASKSFHQGWGLLHNQNKTAKALALELFTRLVVRVTSLISWGLYGAFFINIMLPFILVLNQMGVDLITSSKHVGWFACVGALLLLMLSIHLHIVFARLVFLRPRLIGGDQAILEAEAEADTHDTRET